MKISNSVKVIPTPFQDLFVVEPRIFGDDRGYFFESFNARAFREQTGLDLVFVQDNESLSQEGVLRGLHFQQPPHAQGKLVRVTNGAVLDVVVDLRTDQPTYGQYFSIELNAENKKQMYVPPGFAHGFVTLVDRTRFLYKCTAYYHPESEASILWNDASLKIDWKWKGQPQLSDKDLRGMTFADFQSPF